MKHLFMQSLLWVFLISPQGVISNEKSNLSINHFSDLPLISSPKLSPDGQNMAFLVSSKQKIMVAIQNNNSGKVVPVPTYKKRKILWFKWASENMLLIGYRISHFTKSIRVTQTYTRTAVYNITDEKLTWLKDSNSGAAIYLRLSQSKFADNTAELIDFLPNDPQHVLIKGYFNGVTTIRKINIHTRKAVPYSSLDASKRSHFLTDQAHKLRAAWGFDYLKQTYRISYKSARTGKWSILHEAKYGHSDVFRILSFTNDPEVAYVLKTSPYGTSGVYLINLETKKTVKEVFVHPKFDAQGLRHTISNKSDYTAAQGKVASVIYTDDIEKQFFIDPFSEKLQKIIDKAFPDKINTIVNQLKSKNLYIVFSESLTDAGSYYLLNLDTKKLDLVGQKRPSLPTDKLASIEKVNIPVRDGSTIPAYLTFPKGSKRKNLSAIIIPHGGPNSRDTMHFDYLSQFLANRGYLVIQPNFRGSSGYGKSYLLKGQRQWGGLMQQDIVDATDWAIQSGIVNAKKICLLGWSYGGYSALIGAVQTPEKYKCFASINGISNIPAIKSQDKEIYSFGRQSSKLIGLEGVNDKIISPYHQYKKIKRPILLVATKTDERVSYKQTTSMHSKLKKKRLSELVLLEEGGHNILHNKNRKILLTKLEEFLAKHIK